MIPRMNVYEYAKSCPAVLTDATGTTTCPCMSWWYWTNWAAEQTGSSIGFPPPYPPPPAQPQRPCDEAWEVTRRYSYWVINNCQEELQGQACTFPDSTTRYVCGDATFSESLSGGSDCVKRFLVKERRDVTWKDYSCGFPSQTWYSNVGSEVHYGIIVTRQWMEKREKFNMWEI
jgi:hypothetical protein